MTELAGVIGDPISHSLSPRLHNAAYAALGIDWTYLGFEVKANDVPAAIEGARALGLRGLSVTMPHKQPVIAACNQLSRRVELLGAANTVTFTSRTGPVVADSTDGDGLLGDLTEAGFDAKGQIVAVIGTGGAARAAILALSDAGAKMIVVLGRSVDKGVSAAGLAGTKGNFVPLGSGQTEEALSQCALVVQATPIGMAISGSEDEVTARSVGACLGPGQLALDMVYAPPVTHFLDEAAKHGAVTRNGLGMLIHQAGAQVELWTGMTAPISQMRDAVMTPAPDSRL